MRKRILPALLAIALLISLVGCSGSATVDDAPSSSNIESQTPSLMPEETPSTTPTQDPLLPFCVNLEKSISMIARLDNFILSIPILEILFISKSFRFIESSLSLFSKENGRFLRMEQNSYKLSCIIGVLPPFFFQSCIISDFLIGITLPHLDNWKISAKINFTFSRAEERKVEDKKIRP